MAKRKGQPLGPIARRARGILKQGKTLRSPHLLRAWERLRPMVQRRALREAVSAPVSFVSRTVTKFPKARRRRPVTRPEPVKVTKTPPRGPRRPRGPRKAPRGPVERRPVEMPEDIVEHLLTFSWRSGGKKYTRSLIVPATRGTSDHDLVRQARRELPDGAEKLRPFLREENVRVSVGPGTSRGRTAFRR